MPERPLEDSLNLRSEEVQEILSNPPTWIVRWGIPLIFIFTIIILILSFLIKYPDFISAKVLITTKYPTEKIIARNSGQLDEIFIKNGDSVIANQVLAIIENSADFRHINKLNTMLDTIDLDLGSFSFPINQTTSLILGDIEDAYINFEKSYVDYLLLKDLEPYNNQLKGNKLSLKEINERLSEQLKQKYLLEKEYDLKQVDFNRYKQLFEKGVISQQEYESKQLEFIQIQKNINSMAMAISQMREAISSANQELNTIRINREEDSTRFVKNLTQSYNVLQKAIREWKDNYVLAASINGIVSFQEYWGANQFIRTGEIIFSILPSDTTDLVGKLTIASQNAGKVTLNQKVLVKLDNFPYQQYGMLVGKVENISISPDAEGNYIVYIILPKGSETSYGQRLGFTQEMLGNAEIITEDLSIAERLFFKFKDLLKY